MTKAANTTERSIVLVGRENGVSIIPRPTPLTRLRYFDGKFLRAADLELEQKYQRELVARSNQAGGSGVVHGFDCTLDGDALTLGAGLAIDPRGRVLLLPEERRLSLGELLDSSRARAVSAVQRRVPDGDGGRFGDCEEAAGEDGAATADGTSLHLLVAFHAEALCGEEDVYGKLCEEACVTSTERPYVVEGVVVRAVPLDLVTPLPTSTAVSFTGRHLRSRVAAAFFADERRAVASLVSRQGLASDAWCRGALAAAGSGVPLALVARAGSDTLFLDAWTVRRERMEAPPRRHWARVLALRPWDVFLAQVLQFQCQLRRALDVARDPELRDDPCADAHRLLADASEGIERVLLGVAEERATEEEVLAWREATTSGDREAAFRLRDTLLGGEEVPSELKSLDAIRSRLATAARAWFAPARQRVLLEGGLVELPPAGYLPVLPDSAVDVQQQVRQMVGEGLDLRFCVVRPDFVPHALEEAQHRDRISLTAGLDDPGTKPRVDVLVPDGVVERAPAAVPGTGYRVQVRLEQIALNLLSKLEGSLDARDVHELPDGIATHRLRRAHAATAPETFRETGSLSIRLFGAARGESLPGGGTAFHLAARTPRPDRTDDRPGDDPGFDFGWSTASPGRDAAAAFDRRLSRMSATERLRSTAPFSGVSAAGGSIGIDPIRREPADREPVDREPVDWAPVNLGAGIPVWQTPASLWVTLRAERDPFALAVHGSCPVSTELTLLYPAQVPRHLQRLHASPTLTVTERRELPGGGTALKTRLTGIATVTDTQVDGKVSGIRAVPLDVEVRLERDGDDPATVRVALPGSGLWPVDLRFQVRVERRWPAADRAQVRGESRVGKGEPGPSLFAVDQWVDPAVLTPGDPAHGESLAALEELAGALGDADFADRAARELFPPPEATAEEVRVRATRDWVLFHRRRDKDCGEVADPVRRVQPRRYRLFHVGLREAAAVPTLREALASGTTLPGFVPRLVGTVEFAAGIQSVQTPHDEVRITWDSRVPDGSEMVYGAVASTGPAIDEGEALATARLNALTRVLEPVTGRTPEARLEPLAAVPAALSPGDGDGVMVVATVRLAMACNEVFRLELPEGEIEGVVNALDGASLAPVLKRLGVRRLGKAGFREGSGEPAGPGLADVPQQWTLQGDGPVAEALCVLPEGTGEPQLEVAREQARVLAAATTPSGEPPSSVHAVRSADASLGECGAVTLLVARPAVAVTCHDVLRIAPTTEGNLEELVNVISRRGVLPEDLQAGGVVRLGAVGFAADSAEVQGETLGPVLRTWKTTLEAGEVPQGFRVRGIAVSPRDASPEVRELQREQGDEILQALGGSGGVYAATNGAEALPVQCDALTLVALVRTGAEILPVFRPTASGEPELVLAPRFDEAGNLVRDEAFERDLAELEESGVRFARLSLAAGERPEGGDPRLAALDQALKEAGLLQEGARRTTRILRPPQRRELEERVGATVPVAVLLETD